MGKTSLVVESYPLLNANRKKDKKRSKTRAAAKLSKFNAEAKADVKQQRRLNQKTIDKSRARKRLLKNTELELKTPEQEEDAYHEVECAELVAIYDQMLKEMTEEW